MRSFRRRPDIMAFAGAISVFLGCAVHAAVAQSPAPVDLARGEHIATALAGCTDCHGANFAGGRAFTRGGVSVVASNLTGGAGGISATSDADVRRAIRRGIAPDGTPLLVMPWREYAVMTDADVADLVAYLRSLSPVDNVVSRAAHDAPAVAAASGSEAGGSRPADPNTSVAPVSPAPLVGGAYLATIGGCRNCHGANLAGTVRPNGTVSPNISHDGIGAWSFTDFQTAMRTGTTPGGHVLAGEMPWKSIGRMTDEELRTLYAYLESQSAAPR